MSKVEVHQMSHIHEAAVTRACEHLLSNGVPLTDDERKLLEYHVNDMVPEFLTDKSLSAIFGEPSGSVKRGGCPQPIRAYR